MLSRDSQREQSAGESNGQHSVDGGGQRSGHGAGRGAHNSFTFAALARMLCSNNSAVEAFTASNGDGRGSGRGSPK